MIASKRESERTEDSMLAGPERPSTAFPFARSKNSIPKCAE
jgi:hypothetical protein